MPRGGVRPGAGRKADPNSQRQKALAKRAAKKPAAKKAAAPDLGRGLTLPNGQKSPDAPEGWPFGTKPPEEPAATPDPDNDDGLTDEQRSGLTPLEYLLAVMRSPNASKSARLQAAVQAAPYVHAKPAPQGKKDGRKDAAKSAGGGKFGSAPPPLSLVRR